MQQYPEVALQIDINLLVCSRIFFFRFFVCQVISLDQLLKNEQELYAVQKDVISFERQTKIELLALIKTIHVTYNENYSCIFMLRLKQDLIERILSEIPMKT